MAIRPFWFTDTVALTASGSGTARLTVNAGEKARFKRIQFVSTNTFNITDIRDASGQPYSDVDGSNPIPNTMLNDSALDLSGISRFDPPLEIEGSNSLNFGLTDTSAAANTVRIIAEGEKET